MFANYRHQSDVAHAYQVLRRGGYAEDRIVVMMMDDVANDHSNPQPGKLFNKPGGPDNYEGLVVDYRGRDVTAETFLAVLTANASGVAGKGNGKMIASGPNDRVFVFYSDHGAPGVLGMPTGAFLFADQLHAAIRSKRDAAGFREMVLYIEACESGSIFDGLLEEYISVLGVTASNAIESSWGTYCPKWPPAPGPPTPGPAPDMGIGTCLGDLFSVSWMEDAEDEDLTSETLREQFRLVRARTSDNFTYAMGSHVMHFGQMSMQNEKAGDYEGSMNTGGGGRGAAAANGRAVAPAEPRPAEPDRHHGVPQRDADLLHLRHQADNGADDAVRTAAHAALGRELARRAAVDSAARAAAEQLLRSPGTSRALAGAMRLSAHELFVRRGGGGGGGAAHAGVHTSARGDGAAAAVDVSAAADNRLSLGVADAAVDALLSAPLASRRQSGVPLVDDWDCLRGMVAAWQDVCHAGGRMDQYAMKHTRLFANLCNAGVRPAQLSAAMGETGGCGEHTGAAPVLAV